MNTKATSESLSQPITGFRLLISLSSILIFGTTAIDLIKRNWFHPSQMMVIPLLLCAVISGLCGYLILPLLQKLKTGQIIREEGPQSHLKKAGTPTMGGIFFIPVAIVISLFWTGFSENSIAASLITLSYFLIGFLDDWKILKQKSNKGISPKTKLILQTVAGILFCIWLWKSKFPEITIIQLPGNIYLQLGLLFLPLTLFVLAAESNATNLTDGVDGLAAGTSAIAFWGLAIITIPTSFDLAIFSLCMSGACLGFLVHNHHKARVFMGDTGSLALGGAFAAIGLISGNLWSLFVVSGIFFIESLSVIFQVTYYKATKGKDGKGKRLFKMAPIHHHLELSGWSETKVVGVFYLINLVLVAIAYIVR